MADFQTITREELKDKLERDDQFVLLDVLGERSYTRAHLPGAEMVDAHGEDLLEQVESLVRDRDTEVVVYCASFDCQLSPWVAEKLIEAGYSRVLDYEGGLKDWVEGGYELEGEEAQEVKEILAERSEDEEDMDDEE